MNFPRATTDFFVQEYWDITLNTKLGKTLTAANNATTGTGFSFGIGNAFYAKFMSG